MKDLEYLVGKKVHFTVPDNTDYEPFDVTGIVAEIEDGFALTIVEESDPRIKLLCFNYNVQINEDSPLLESDWKESFNMAVEQIEAGKVNGLEINNILIQSLTESFVDGGRSTQSKCAFGE